VQICRIAEVRRNLEEESRLSFVGKMSAELRNVRKGALYAYDGETFCKGTNVFLRFRFLEFTLTLLPRFFLQLRV
jgi:hypothetical protein